MRDVAGQKILAGDTVAFTTGNPDPVTMLRQGSRLCLASVRVASDTWIRVVKHVVSGRERTAVDIDKPYKVIVLVGYREPSLLADRAKMYSNNHKPPRKKTKKKC